MSLPPSDPRFAGLDVPAPDFANDDGSPEPALADALAAHGAGRATRYDVVAALLPGRLLVPVVAVLDELEPESAHQHDDTPAPGHAGVDPTALRREKSSHMAAVTLVTPDGRRGLLAFTGTHSMGDWRPDARPVPVTAVAAAQAALDDGADALLVDVAGPHRFALTGAGLRALAQGRPWLPPAADPTVADAITAVMAAFDDVVGVQLEPSPDDSADIVVVLAPKPGHVASEIPDVATRAAAALGENPVLRDRLERGLALALDAAAL